MKSGSSVERQTPRVAPFVSSVVHLLLLPSSIVGHLQYNKVRRDPSRLKHSHCEQKLRLVPKHTLARAGRLHDTASRCWHQVTDLL